MDNQLPKSHISSITVKDLFGFLTYDIVLKKQQDIIIFYGENGSGKTTILNLLFHMLSPEDNRGHKTYVASVPFREFTVSFFDGYQVTAHRRKKEIIGHYTLSIKNKNCILASHLFRLNPERVVGEQDDRTYIPLLQELENLQLGLFLLPDDRKVQSNLGDEDEMTRPRLLREIRSVSDYRINLEEEEKENTDKLVEQALNRSMHWIRSQAYSASRQGEDDTSNIYTEIVKRIATVRKQSREKNKMTFKQLICKAIELQERSLHFNRLGLSSPFEEITDLIPLIQNVPSQKKGTINQVLSPYLRSYEARLNALDVLREILETFSNIFNQFYNYKTLQFNLRDGISIVINYNKNSLDPKGLSSGEKQLLLLFCNVLLARDRPSIFIIDEPELSLNIKWQRELISSLISCVKGCDVQFIFATHSLEMIALHKSYAIRLKDRE